jgi:ureidoacrylate peracid hydrolase
MKLAVKTKPEPIEMDTRSAAVIVVDMQNAFLANGGVFDLAGIDISQSGRIVHIIQQILERTREIGIQVVYLKMGYKEDLSNSGGPSSPNWHKEFALCLARNNPDLRGKLLTEGSWNFEIVEELKPHPEDLVVVKSRYSGFAGTELESLLHARKIHYLFFTGMATNVCVESTLRDAYCLDFWPILIKDATLQAGPDVLQQATVQNVENHFGWTLNSREFLQTLKG